MKSDQHGGALFDDTALGNEAGRFRHGLGQHAPDREIAAVGPAGEVAPSQCEDLNAGERGFRLGQVLAFADGDIRDGPQHDDRGNGQFQRKRSQAERPSHRS